MRTETASRTFVGSVVCVDLVGYSKRSIAQQSAIKATFNRLLVRALKGIPPEDRIILDTGDGAAVSFLGDPEACFAAGLRMRDMMNGAAAQLGCDDADEGPVRIGINLGPVKLAVDLNGRPNIIGDGINVAEKIVAFARPGQLVVSRPFHEMMSRISEEHAKKFRYEGVRTDRNVREHEIYSLEDGPRAREPVAPPPEAAAAPPSPPALQAQRAAAAAGQGALLSFLRDRTKVAVAAGALLAVIALESWLLANRPAPELSPTALAPSAVPAPGQPVAAKPGEPEPVKPPPLAEPKPAPRSEPRPPAIETKPPAIETKPPAVETKRPVAETKAPVVDRKAPPAIETKPAPAKPEPPKEARKPAEPPKETRKTPEEAARVIPPPRPTPPQAAPTVPIAPAAPPAEAAPAIREEPRSSTPPAVPPPEPAATLQAIPVKRAPLNFPVVAAARGIHSGTVRARLSINAAGVVTQVTVLSSDPPRIFDREASRSLEEWTFNPGADNRSYEVEIAFKR